MKNLIKKRHFSIILVLILVLSATITGCSNKNEEEVVTIKLGHHHNVGGVVDVYCEKFAELASEKSNGGIKIDVYPGSQLGSELEVAEGILLGTQQMVGVSTSAYNNLIKGFGLDTLPFMFDSYESIMDAFTNSEVGDELQNRILERDGRIIGWIALGGSRNMVFTDKNVKSVNEMKGMKMRSPEIDLFVGMFEAVGARPTPIPWGETYTALQTNVVDGMDSSTTSIKDMKFYEVSNYCLLTNHMRSTFNLVINDTFFQGLPENTQQILIDSGEEASVYANKISIEEENEVMDYLVEKGMIFNEISQEEADMMKESMELVIDKWGKDHDATELIEMLRKRD